LALRLNTDIDTANCRKSSIDTVSQSNSKKTRKKSTAKSTNPDFEKSLAELETLVERMEQGDQTLEQSLKDFERGVALTRSCQQALKAAEQKVEQLLEQNGQEELVPFEPEDQ
jgi:exodeoxyribonuclease VII small subunit